MIFLGNFQKANLPVDLLEKGIILGKELFKDQQFSRREKGKIFLFLWRDSEEKEMRW